MDTVAQEERMIDELMLYFELILKLVNGDIEVGADGYPMTQVDAIESLVRCAKATIREF